MTDLITKELKTKWVEALRSGEYQQLQGALYDGKNSYCCLGVLQRVRGTEVPTAHTDKDGDDDVWSDPDDFKYSKTFERLVPKWYDLACMNDKGESFLGIADYIEKNIEAQ